MSFLNELELLFESETIKPTFNNVHIILSLLIFDQNPEGIGRYRLKSELLIGSGTSKSLVKRLEERVNFIKVKDEVGKSERQNVRKGHVLTAKGSKFLDKIKLKIPLLTKGDLSILKEIIIDAENNFLYYCLVRDAAHRITNGIEQRDAAIKVNGSGATCLIFNGKNLVFPSSSENEQERTKVNLNILNYFKRNLSKYTSEFRKNDAIIIGLGKSPELARLASLNAALTLF
ncbi:MAG: DUF4443 domain-containing protein [Candidatus Heimdallarchaeota archaeon]